LCTFKMIRFAINVKFRLLGEFEARLTSAYKWMELSTDSMRKVKSYSTYM
jgi:hypothetical protein